MYIYIYTYIYIIFIYGIALHCIERLITSRDILLLRMCSVPFVFYVTRNLKGSSKSVGTG